MSAHVPSASIIKSIAHFGKHVFQDNVPQRTAHIGPCFTHPQHLSHGRCNARVLTRSQQHVSRRWYSKLIFEHGNSFSRTAQRTEQMDQLRQTKTKDVELCLQLRPRLRTVKNCDRWSPHIVGRLVKTRFCNHLRVRISRQRTRMGVTKTSIPPVRDPYRSLNNMGVYLSANRRRRTQEFMPMMNFKVFQL